MQIQSTEWIIPKIQKQFETNPNRSLSASFRHFRKYPALSLIGDYPLLTCILLTISQMGIVLTRAKLVYTFSQSEEFRVSSKKEKTELLDQLLKLSHVQSKHFPKNQESVFDISVEGYIIKS